MIISAGGNGVLDPGETVTVALGVQNAGGPGVSLHDGRTDSGRCRQPVA